MVIHFPLIFTNKLQAKFFKELKLEEPVTCIDFSPSGDLFAVGLLDERVLVWYFNDKCNFIL